MRSAYAVRGDVHRMMSDYDAAIADCTEAIKLEPENAFALSVRASRAPPEGRVGRALADASEAIRIDPKSVAAYWNRAEGWRGKSDYEQAIADCNEALRLDPEYVAAYCTRAEAWCRERGLRSGHCRLYGSYPA